MTQLDRNTIVAAARGWLGTAYQHQASCKGAGTDCLGLLRGVWREIYGREPADIPPYTLDWSEPSGEERLWQAATVHLLPVVEAEPIKTGEVLLFRMRTVGVAKHLGIVSRAGPHTAFIHAYSKYGVVETSLSLPWRNRVVARFDFPEIKQG
jgi:NlpC/P60 family putative phage cell wall peptidase